MIPFDCNEFYELYRKFPCYLSTSFGYYASSCAIVLGIVPLVSLSRTKTKRPDNSTASSVEDDPLQQSNHCDNPRQVAGPGVTAWTGAGPARLGSETEKLRKKLTTANRGTGQYSCFRHRTSVTIH